MNYSDDMSQTKGASAGREWTEQETLLLLEVGESLIVCMTHSHF